MTVDARVVDGKATKALDKAEPGTSPFTQERVPNSGFQANRAVMVCLSSSLEVTYEEPATGRAAHGITRWDVRWSPVSRVKQLMGGSLTAEGAGMIMLLQQLGTQEEPDQPSGTDLWRGREGPFAAHLLNNCPEFDFRPLQSFHV